MKLSWISLAFGAELVHTVLTRSFTFRRSVAVNWNFSGVLTTCGLLSGAKIRTIESAQPAPSTNRQAERDLQARGDITLGSILEWSSTGTPAPQTCWYSRRG